jgi:hypothetical protein
LNFSNISIDVLYEFFKNLNGAPDHDDVELSVLSESLQENLDFDNLNIHLNDIRGEIRLKKYLIYYLTPM